MVCGVFNMVISAEHREDILFAVLELQSLTLLLGFRGDVVYRLLADCLGFLDIQSIEVDFELGVEALPLINGIEYFPCNFPPDFLLPIIILFLFLLVQFRHNVSVFFHARAQVVLVQVLIRLISFHIHLNRHLLVEFSDPHLAAGITFGILDNLEILEESLKICLVPEFVLYNRWLREERFVSSRNNVRQSLWELTFECRPLLHRAIHDICRRVHNHAIRYQIFANSGLS